MRHLFPAFSITLEESLKVHAEAHPIDDEFKVEARGFPVDTTHYTMKSIPVVFVLFVGVEEEYASPLAWQ